MEGNAISHCVVGKNAQMTIFIQAQRSVVGIVLYYTQSHGKLENGWMDWLAPRELSPTDRHIFIWQPRETDSGQELFPVRMAVGGVSEHILPLEHLDLILKRHIQTSVTLSTVRRSSNADQTAKLLLCCPTLIEKYSTGTDTYTI